MLIYFQNVKIVILLVSVFLTQCTTVDFIPESDHRPENPNYEKKSWEEVEVTFSRPDKRIDIQGAVHVRDYEGSGRIQDYLVSLKRDMFRRKMDGVWFSQSKIQSMRDTVIQTMDARGNVTHAFESESQIRIWKGYAYRDR